MNAAVSRSPASVDPLVEALAARLHCVDLTGWAQITARAEELHLSFEDLRLLLAITTTNGPTGVSDLSRISGLGLDAAHQTVNRLRGRGYLREERRQYSLSPAGRELDALLHAAHREGIQAYIDGLEPREQKWLKEAVQMFA